MNIHIEKVNVEKILPVRQAILRNGKPLEECYFDGDLADATTHLALYKNNDIVAIATLLYNKSAFICKKNQYQLRGMAVVKKEQKTGFGKQLLTYTEKIILQKKPATLWFNARSSAVLFYKKNNFKIIGEEFLIPKVGPHYLMYKEYE